jgi:hypothetical protein
MYDSWIYNSLCNKCLWPLTTKIVSSNPTQGKVYSIQLQMVFLITSGMKIGVRVMVFNTTCNNISFYCGDQFFWWRKDYFSLYGAYICVFCVCLRVVVSNTSWIYEWHEWCLIIYFIFDMSLLSIYLAIVILDVNHFQIIFMDFFVAVHH